MYLEVGERALVVLVGVWAGSAQREKAGSLCFPSSPGASCLPGGCSKSCERALLTKHILEVLACCCCPSCSPRQLPKLWQSLARGANQ